MALIVKRVVYTDVTVDTFLCWEPVLPGYFRGENADTTNTVPPHFGTVECPTHGLVSFNLIRPRHQIILTVPWSDGVDDHSITFCAIFEPDLEESPPLSCAYAESILASSAFRTGFAAHPVHGGHQGIFQGRGESFSRGGSSRGESSGRGTSCERASAGVHPELSVESQGIAGRLRSSRGGSSHGASFGRGRFSGQGRVHQDQGTGQDRSSRGGSSRRSSRGGSSRGASSGRGTPEVYEDRPVHFRGQRRPSRGVSSRNVSSGRDTGRGASSGGTFSGRCRSCGGFWSNRV